MAVHQTFGYFTTWTITITFVTVIHKPAALGFVTYELELDHILSFESLLIF
jgi:hypothetical protein